MCLAFNERFDFDNDSSQESIVGENNLEEFPRYSINDFRPLLSFMISDEKTTIALSLSLSYSLAFVRREN